jgi:hypothetical protein
MSKCRLDNGIVELALSLCKLAYGVVGLAYRIVDRTPVVMTPDEPPPVPILVGALSDDFYSGRLRQRSVAV